MRRKVQFLSVRSLDGKLPSRLGDVLARRHSAVVHGDARQVLSALPENSVQTTITSPPYWSLRDYGSPGQIGAEDSPDEYVRKVLCVLEQVRRVTRPDGTLWLNVGDSYTSGGRTWRAPDKKHPVRAMRYRPPTPDGLKPKELVGVPWRLAFAAQQAGWYLRADVVWNKPNCMPDSVKDRPTRAHEYLFLFSKNERYFYRPDAVRGPNDRNIRTVWDIPTEPYAGAHFATFPKRLVEQCLLLTSREDDLVLDPFIGAGTVGLVAVQQARRFVGVELSDKYLRLIKKRFSHESQLALQS